MSGSFFFLVVGDGVSLINLDCGGRVMLSLSSRDQLAFDQDQLEEHSLMNMLDDNTSTWFSKQFHRHNAGRNR